MKNLVRLGVTLIVFATSGANAFWGLGFLAGGLAALGASIVGSKGISNVASSTVSGAHDVCEHARQVINQSLDKFDGMAKEHIKEINRLEDKIVEDIKAIEQSISEDLDLKIERINSIIEEAIVEASKIEERFYSDLEEAIEKAECAADKVLIEYFANVLGRFGVLIGMNEIRVFPPLLYSGEREGHYCVLGYCAADHEVYRDFHIKTPNFSATYDDIKKYLLGRLEKIRPDTPIDSLIITYSILSELARRTICFHPGVDRFVKDHLFFRDKLVQLQKFSNRQNYKGYKVYEKENEDNFVVNSDL